MKIAEMSDEELQSLLQDIIKEGFYSSNVIQVIKEEFGLQEARLDYMYLLNLELAKVFCDRMESYKRMGEAAIQGNLW